MKEGEENARLRLCRMLEADKEEMNAPSREAALRDFTRVAREYFETDGDVTIGFERKKGGTEVTVRFLSVRVKNFSVLK